MNTHLVNLHGSVTRISVSEQWGIPKVAIETWEIGNFHKPKRNGVVTWLSYHSETNLVIIKKVQCPKHWEVVQGGPYHQ